MPLHWYHKTFDKLTPQELYKIMQLRIEVFIIEQKCIFQDADNKDEGCLHLMGVENGVLKAYTRLAPPGYIYKETSIGRVVTSPKYRSKGLGKELMQHSIATCRQEFGNGTIKIGAQYYLLKFYSSLGFKVCSDIYLEDGIEHVYMKLED
jgi:ElaA protein